MTEERVIRQCQHCGNHTAFVLHGTYLHKELLSKNIYHITEWCMLECITCSHPMLEQTTKIIQEKREGYEETYEEWEEILEEPQTNVIYPITDLASIPLPSHDMPEDITADYNEARAILGSSPRSSAALLRLVLQKLCKHLGLPGENLNEDIGVLVGRGLSIQIQQALDIIRVIGNNAVHPGEVDLREEKESVLKLFEIINFIVNQMITQPREIARIFEELPEGSKQAIVKRTQKNFDIINRQKAQTNPD